MYNLGKPGLRALVPTRKTALSKIPCPPNFMINNLLFDTEPYLKPTCFMEMIHKISAHAEAGRMGAFFNSTVAIAPKI